MTASISTIMPAKLWPIFLSMTAIKDLQSLETACSNETIEVATKGWLRPQKFMNTAVHMTIDLCKGTMSFCCA